LPRRGLGLAGLNDNGYVDTAWTKLEPAMLKYISTAAALKFFSSSKLMRNQYRRLGNALGGKRRCNETMPSYYPDRLKRMLRLAKQFEIVRDGDLILELGTGWLHWEAITLRLFFEIKAVLFDVWDNRQLGGIKNYLHQLSLLLSKDFGLSGDEIQRSHCMIKAILKVKSLHELYDLLGFEYHVEEAGNLNGFSDGSFRLIVSAGVLEHVKEQAVPTLIAETQRILEPKGWALHSIDTSDHLAHYDKSAPRKLYLRFSEPTWHRFFENSVQYVNRIQRGDWLRLFMENRFELIEEESNQTDISGLKLATRYSQLPKKDLACTVLRMLLRKAVC
jgi:ubiquinone/menaquinone biosynthesis C-methylase UbiE